MDHLETNIIPNFEINRLPNLRIKSVRIQNLKSYEDCTFDFLDNQFVCFIGPNGTGKSTALEIIQMIFSRFDGSEIERLNAYLGKIVRQTQGRHNSYFTNEDFLITAQIAYENGDYEIQINKSGFVKDHPKELKNILYRLCYLSTLDKELHKFQLIKEKWSVFKELFEKITGYEVFQDENSLDNVSFDPLVNHEMSKYVLSFWVKKPNETVFYRDCSDGERKVIKSLSTLLNMEFTPKIILIDNIEMHVESKRHIPLVQSLKKCFPESQIFATTHSIKISKNFKIQKEIYDLRLINANNILKNKLWRLYFIDEIDDLISKSECLYDEKKSQYLVEYGLSLRKKMIENACEEELILMTKKFTEDVNKEFLNDMLGLQLEPKIINNKQEQKQR